MNEKFKKKLIKKIKDELNRTDEEINLIDTNLSLLAKKKKHLKEMVTDWHVILDELLLY
jgi:archaellum component FlaC